jgi:hypothetical protein
MSAPVPQAEAIFANSKRTKMEISKALATLGFGAWNELEPGKLSDGSTAMPTHPTEASAGFKHYAKKLG